MMHVLEILEMAVDKHASDIFIIPGLSVSLKINGKIEKATEQPLFSEDTRNMLQELYELGERVKFNEFLQQGDDDFSFSVQETGRFRVSAFRQRGSLAAVIRVVPFELPDYRTLGIPEEVMEFSDKNSGLVLVTGPSGSGKSTTLSCIIDRINKTRNCHVLTLEDPIEFLYRHNKSIVSQREIELDTQSYVKALRAALRQSPDVIFVGEMRDLETIDIVMTAAETGHLVLSTLHTVGTANTIDRIIDVFPPAQQHQIRLQLAMVLQGVVSQQLIPSYDGGRVPAFEIMTASNAIRSLIRESKVHQIEGVIYSSADQGMRTMDASIVKLYKDGKINREMALRYSTNYDVVERQIDLLQPVGQ